MSDILADLCSRYSEELSGLQLLDPCPVCGVKVGRHARNPAAAHAVALASSIDNQSGGTSIFTKLMKIATQLPNWTKQSVCRTFLEKISLIMPNSGVPSIKWNLVFRHLLSDDIIALRWVTANIIDKDLDWEASKIAFTAHFQTSDHNETLKMEFRACKQGPKEFVQSYADRFTNYLTQLGFNEDDPLVILLFTDNMRADIRKEFKKSEALTKRAAPAYVIDTLHKATQLAIEIDVLNRTNELTINESGQSGSSSTKSGLSSGSSGAGEKKCKHHPNSTNHTTAECKNPKPASNNQSGAAGASSASSSGNNQSKPKTGDGNSKEWQRSATCHTCGQVGHISPNCPKKEASGTRQSERPSNPPARLTYEQKGQPAEQKSALAGRAICVVEPPLAAESVSGATALDRTLPACVFAPTETKRYVWFVVAGTPYKALVDQGADVSIIDAGLAKQLGVEISPVSGELLQVSSAAPAARIGRTAAPLPVTCVTSMPHVYFPSKEFNHQFEVLPLSGDYQFILGVDCMLDLIPVNLIGHFVPRPCTKSVGSAVRAVSAVELSPSADTLSLADVQLVEQNDGRAAIIDLDNDHRTCVSTPAALEAEYAPNRERLMANPDFVAALERNRQVTGFCNLPETVVHLEVDPAQKHLLFRKQYKVPQVHHAGVDEIIQRWLATGKIERAPPGCEYNNLLLIVPKKDENGQLTGIRPVLDVRALNKALLNNDTFQLPKIRDELESFGRCRIFGSIDLKEAYLQFMVDKESRKYTAFTWKGIQYQFVGAPFGLSLLPSHFQRAMSFILSDLPYSFAYLRQRSLWC